ncbi:MAG: hypothetical protein ABI591_03600 [Kofleriaceae bacterium]
MNRLRLKHFVPLAGFLIPSIIIGYGFVIPSGVNKLSIGFAGSLVGASVSYVIGIVTALRG